MNRNLSTWVCGVHDDRSKDIGAIGFTVMLDDKGRAN
jgi:hypothetical protein